MKHNKGFTLTEMLIVVAILGIVTSMAFPDIVSFFDRSREEQERYQLKEIQAALEAYAEHEGELPADDASWAAAIAPYTKMSEVTIANSVFDHAREYERTEETQTYRGATVTYHYATITSLGQNGELEDGSGGSGAYVDRLGDASDYADISASGDDEVAKFTDRQIKTRAYELTFDRLNRISKALASYSALKQNEDIVAGTANAELMLYFPPSQGTGDTLAIYGASPRADVTTFAGESTIRNSAVSDGARRTSMESLMRILGLPEDNCCSALAKGDDDAPMPFFYYSNPIARIGAGCAAARPGLNDRKLPPRISLEEDTCA